MADPINMMSDTDKALSAMIILGALGVFLAVCAWAIIDVWRSGRGGGL